MAGKARRSVTLDSKVDADLERYRIRRGWTRSLVIQEALKSYLSHAAFFVDTDMSNGHSVHVPEEAKR